MTNELKSENRFNKLVPKCRVCACVLSRVRLIVTSWIAELQAPLPVGFSRQEYWSGLPFPSPVDLPNPGMQPAFPVSCLGRGILYH